MHKALMAKAKGLWQHIKAHFALPVPKYYQVTARDLVLGVLRSTGPVSRDGLSARVFCLTKIINVDLGWYCPASQPESWRSWELGLAYGVLLTDHLISMTEDWRDGHTVPVVTITSRGRDAVDRLGVYEPISWWRLTAGVDRLRHAAAELEALEARQADRAWCRAIELWQPIQRGLRPAELLADAPPERVIEDDDALEILRRLGLVWPAQYAPM